MDLEKELAQANHDFAWAKHELEAMRTGHTINESDSSMVEAR